jgi:bacterioferritin
MFTQNAVAGNVFLNDISVLRQNAQKLMQAAPPAPDGATAIALLQSVLSAEIVCVLRYTMISVSQDGLKNPAIGAEFQEQANDERRHMMMAAARIEQLGGTPDFSPRVSAEAAIPPDADFPRRVRENLAAEQSVIAHYHDLIGFFADKDPHTSAMLGEIMRDEEDHTSDMEDLLASYAS